MQRFIVIGLVILVFVAFLVSYTVRFTETAVVSTWGRASESSVVKEGLHFKIPFVQRVTKYDTRARFMESTPETQQTQDDSPIIVTAYATWRVSDPLKFFRAYSGKGETAAEHYKAAEDALMSQLRSAMSEVSRYGFSQLLGGGAGGGGLAELEKNILARLKGGGPEGSATLAANGVETLSVGITSVALPAANTTEVFKRMNANRAKIANETINQGASQAQTIRAKAESDAQRILAFADRLAQDIVNQGNAEVAQFLKPMEADPGLAVFLQKMEFLRSGISSRTTLVLPTSMPGMDMFRPDADKLFKDGVAPGLQGLEKSPTEGKKIAGEKP